jgi:hypothetical protein
MPRILASASLLLILGHAAVASAQDTGDPLDVPGEGEAGASGEASASGEVSAGGEVSASGAGGGGSAAGFGVGAMAMLTGPFGAAIIYDPGAFHIEGILGFESNGVTTILAGGRFWYHMHTSTAADFSVGGGLGIASTEQDNGFGDNEDVTTIHLEGGGQLRVFVVPNVALSATAGLAVVTGDDRDLIAVTGQLIGDVGLSYFF